jgi:hypothetical protein
LHNINTVPFTTFICSRGPNNPEKPRTKTRTFKAECGSKIVYTVGTVDGKLKEAPRFEKQYCQANCISCLKMDILARKVIDKG